MVCKNTVSKEPGETRCNSFERYCLLAETMSQGVIHLDGQGTILSMNPAAQRILGCSCEQFLHSGSVHIEHHAIRENGECFLDSDHPATVALRTGVTESGVIMGVFNTKCNDYRWLRVDAVPAFRSGDSNPSGVSVLFEDITERKRDAKTLQNSEECYRRLFEVESDAILMHDWVTGQILDVNSSAISMYGYSFKEFLEMKHTDISAEPSITENAVRNNETFIPLRFHRKKDGSVFPAEISICYFEYQSRKVHVAVIRDISLRLQGEERLVELNSNLRALGDHLQKVQEQERLAIARDIHDEIGQNITVLKLDLEWIELRIPVDGHDLKERVNEMRASVDQLTTSVQRIASDLRPPLLDSMGLSAAIEWYVAEFSKRSGLESYVMLNEDINPLDQYTATAVMRIVQEGLTNVIRHARATEVSVSLCKRAENLVLEISDNGCGITPEQIASSVAYGLMGMQERARICRGKIEITGKPGCGTVLQLTIPRDAGEQNI